MSDGIGPPRRARAPDVVLADGIDDRAPVSPETVDRGDRWRHREPSPCARDGAVPARPGYGRARCRYQRRLAKSARGARTASRACAYPRCARGMRDIASRGYRFGQPVLGMLEHLGPLRRWWCAAWWCAGVARGVVVRRLCRQGLYRPGRQSDRLDQRLIPPLACPWCMALTAHRSIDAPGHGFARRLARSCAGGMDRDERGPLMRGGHGSRRAWPAHARGHGSRRAWPAHARGAWIATSVARSCAGAWIATSVARSCARGHGSRGTCPAWTPRGVGLVHARGHGSRGTCPA